MSLQPPLASAGDLADARVTCPGDEVTTPAVESTIRVFADDEKGHPRGDVVHASMIALYMAASFPRQGTDSFSLSQFHPGCDGFVTV
jgi:hypothetical protein